MEVLSLRTIHGPNIYHSRPVLVMKLDLQQWAEVASNEIPGFIDSLLQSLPGLNKHTCSPGYEGGFIERLQRGTYMAHIIEHVSLELSAMADIEVSFGKSRYAGAPGIYHVITRFTNEAGMKVCLQKAFEMIDNILVKKDFDVASAVHDIREVAADHAMGPSAMALFEAAKKRNIPCRRVGENSLLYLGYGKYLQKVQTAVTEKTSLIATEMVQDKDFTKSHLDEFSIPVPRGEVVSSEEQLLQVVKTLTLPLAVKPVDGHHGNGITLNVTSEQELRRAFQHAKQECSRVLVEEMVVGNDYRVLVINHKLVAAAERQPPFVIGNGVDSISTLIEKLNQDPRRAEGHSGFLTKVVVDEMLVETLEKQGLGLDTVLTADTKILLRETANLSTGGTAKDVTEDIHPQIKSLCERVARVVGLDICGIDIIASSLAEPVETSGFRVIEVNAGPGLRMHLSPTEGSPRPVGDAIMEMLYPNGTPSRIPIFAVTGTNGKTTIARMMAKMFSAQGQTVGMTSSDGVWIGTDQIMHGDTSGPISARTILNDPGVELAVLEVARGGIMRGGLAYDWSDVGIITNIRNDHFGQDGIDDIEDLVWVKSLVAERVREGGTLILNADDEQSFALSQNPRITRLRKNIVLYGTDRKNPALTQHLAQLKDACWVEDGKFVGYFHGQPVQFGNVDDYPVTLGGTAEFQVSNTLAVIAAGLAHGLRPSQIAASLKAFNPSVENPGRLNLYKIHGATVILDYGHNPDAVAAIGKMLAGYKHYQKTAVFGLPGDRDANLIRESGAMIGNYFDRIILRDDLDLRGRAAGEVPRLLSETLKQTHPQREVIEIFDEKEALECAFRNATAQDLIVVFYDRLDFVKKILREFDPVPVLKLPPMSMKDGKQEISSELTAGVFPPRTVIPAVIESR